MSSAFFAHLRVGACDIAVPAVDIARAIAFPAAGMTLLPRRGHVIAGLIELEHGVVPVVALDRWVALGTAAGGAEAWIIVLRAGRSLIGIQVDALLGLKRIEPATLRTVHRDTDPDELFAAVAPATGERPMLCLLEVGRLMALANAWCDEVDLSPGEARVGAPKVPAPTVRHAVFAIGDDLWAVPAERVVRVAATPVPELRWPGQRTCGICTWDGRKLPVVDLGFADKSVDTARPWMVVVTEGAHSIGVVVSRCDRFLDLTAADIAAAPHDAILAGIAIVAGLGTVAVLDLGKLFRTVPEASMSDSRGGGRADAMPEVTQAVTPETVPGDNSHYLVFEADRHYASPIAGVVGVMALPEAACRDLVAGRRATVVWRGRAVPVVNLPSIDGGPPMQAPRLAVLLDSEGQGEARSAIAIRSLVDWLPANAARRSGMRTPSVGEISMITSQRANGASSVVVVDLAQMAYLLH